MKKRVLSLLLVLVMLISLVPMSVLAKGEDLVTITKQPDPDVFVNAGQTVTIGIEAKANIGNIRYAWVDMEEFNFSGLDSVSTFLSTINNATYGTGAVTSIVVDKNMDGKTIACVVYSSETTRIVSYPIWDYGERYVVSNTVTIHVNPDVCPTHSINTNLSKINAVEPTCAEEGNIEYFECNICHNYFKDAFGLEPIAKKDVVVPKSAVHGEIVHFDALEGNCHQAGNIEYYGCAICGQPFSDAEGTSMISWSVVSTGINAAKHDGLSETPEQPGYCKGEGNIHYWHCSGCGLYWSDAALTHVIDESSITLAKDKTYHPRMETHPAKAPTCAEEGNILYYYCPDCKDYFADKQGTAKISKANIDIDKTDHVYKWEAIEEEDVNGDIVEYHVHKCIGCGRIKDQALHSGGTAYCRAQPICEVCGFEYGYTDPNNHKNCEREIIVEATRTTSGLCNEYCPDCGYTASNVPYELKDLCDHDIAKVERVSPKCEDYEFTTGESAYGVMEHYECTLCGMMFSDKRGENEITDPDTLKIEPLKHYVEYNNTRIENPLVYCKDLNADSLSVTSLASILTGIGNRVFNYQYDEISHWVACKYCGYDFNKTLQLGVHSFNKDQPLTCHSGHTCVCGYDDGARDADNHDGEEVLVGQVYPSSRVKGYTGDIVCSGCDKVLVKGWEYEEVCGKCDGRLSYHKAIPATCTDNGTVEFYECLRCHNRYKDENASILMDNTADIVDKATGHEFHPGLDALMTVNYFDLAEKLFPDLSWREVVEQFLDGDFSLVTDITLDEFIESLQIKDIDHCSDETDHWLGCSKCGLTFYDLKGWFEENGIIIDESWYKISKKEAHSGGVATCTSLAVCNECGDEYGQYGEHRCNWVKVYPEKDPCTAKGEQKWVCTECQWCDDSKTTSIPARGHNFVNGRCVDCGKAMQNPFVDVKTTDYFYEPVMWAVETGVTNGMSATEFGSKLPCTRGQVVTFLYRAAGSPAIKASNNPYVDVKSSDYFYKAVLWAVDKGITKGTSATTFSPNDQCTRGQIVTFLYRACGQPETVGHFCQFYDVSSSDYYYNAVIWAVENKITKGTSSTTFAPNATCIRADVVTFLYRARDLLQH